ncbi:MAG: hypothetical protein AAF727_16980 [Pseudomonadota bacterium]
MKRGDWTWLELAKIGLGILTPLTIFFLSYMIDRSIHERDTLAQKDLSVQRFAQDIYGRRVAAELLASGLRRHSEEPNETSLLEVRERKARYDSAYVDWNTRSQSNLLIIRRLLDSDVYTNLEAIVDRHLVLLGFRPLDNCLTEAYDNAIRGRDASIVLDVCESSGLLDFVLLCGSAITDELARVSFEDSELRSPEALLSGNVALSCEVPEIGGRFRGYARP